MEFGLLNAYLSLVNRVECLWNEENYICFRVCWDSHINLFFIISHSDKSTSNIFRHNSTNSICYSLNNFHKLFKCFRKYIFHRTVYRWRFWMQVCECLQCKYMSIYNCLDFSKTRRSEYCVTINLDRFLTSRCYITLQLLVYGAGQVVPSSFRILKPNLMYSLLVSLSPAVQYGRAILVMDRNFCTDIAGNSFTRMLNSSVHVHIGECYLSCVVVKY